MAFLKINRWYSANRIFFTLNKKGFTAVEMLVSIGIFAVIISLFLSYYDFLNSQQAKITQNYQILDLEQMLFDNLRLNSSNNPTQFCNSLLTGVNFTLKGSGITIPINSIQNNSTSVPFQLMQNQPIPGSKNLLVQSITLQNVSNVDNANKIYSGSLIITFSSTFNNSLPQIEIPQMFVSNDGATVASCYQPSNSNSSSLNSGGNGSIPTSQEICQKTFGTDAWDVSTKRCAFPIKYATDQVCSSTGGKVQNYSTIQTQNLSPFSLKCSNPNIFMTDTYGTTRQCFITTGGTAGNPTSPQTGTSTFKDWINYQGSAKLTQYIYKCN